MSAKNLKKTNTFLLQKTPSMEIPNSPNSTILATKNKYSPAIEFPTSPHTILGEEVLHFSHPQHPLAHINLPDQFTCSGCKEYGAAKRFTCQQCDFQLHEFCALAPQSLKGHTFHFQHPLVFFSKPVKGGILKSKCDVCSKPAGGYTFRCNACSVQIHPCCAMLSADINFPAHPHPLKLLTATTTTPAGNTSFACGECNRRRSGRVYHCTVCDYHLHAVCAKSMVNGLQESGIKEPEKGSKLGAAAWLASQVVKEFIGGLIEGLGQGVGQVLFQNIAKGRCHSRRQID